MSVHVTAIIKSLQIYNNFLNFPEAGDDFYRAAILRTRDFISRWCYLCANFYYEFRRIQSVVCFSIDHASVDCPYWFSLLFLEGIKKNPSDDQNVH